MKNQTPLCVINKLNNIIKRRKKNMWEKDRQVLRSFKECWANVREQLKAGEEVDLASVCVAETEGLVGYTTAVIGYHKANTSQELSEKKQSYYNPKMPYFQNF